MRFRGAIFDVDGTLLDSMHLWTDFGANYLRSRGVEPKPGLKDILRPMTMQQSAEHFQTEYGMTDTVEELAAGVNAMLERQYGYEVQPKPGIVELLQLLRQQGVRMAIATATDRPLVEAALRRCGMWEYFDAVFTCTEVGAGKTKPDIYLRSAEALGTAVSETAVFEDAVHAIHTAKTAGFPVVAIYDDSMAPWQEEIRRDADIYVTDWHQALPLLK